MCLARWINLKLWKTAISCHVATIIVVIVFSKSVNPFQQIMYLHCVKHHLSLIPFIVHPLLVAVLFLYIPYKNAGLRGHNSVNNFYVDQYDVKERGSNPWLVWSCIMWPSVLWADVTNPQGIRRLELIFLVTFTPRSRLFPFITRSGVCYMHEQI